MKNIVLAVIGSRSLSGSSWKSFIFKKLDYLTQNCKVVKFISGGAKGPDTYGYQWMKSRYKFPAIEIHKPDWKQYGRRAGFLRNKFIIKPATHIVAFWDGESKGTLHSIKLAKSLGKQVRVINCKQPVLC